ncbi:hypothetical protein [Litchfieldia alkalitelluris]|uniref:hypothetical protein n=1 Tax=Litchfieldia alkalitelluris TaxID=304268 RepID=UPI000996984F|nr:hypothetical protein [Litchfieldia alkalitelluris]
MSFLSPIVLIGLFYIEFIGIFILYKKHQVVAEKVDGLKELFTGKGKVINNLELIKALTLKLKK